MAENQGKYRVEITKRYEALGQTLVNSTNVGSTVKAAKEVGSKIVYAAANTAIKNVVERSLLRKFSGAESFDEDPNRPLRTSLLGTPLFDYIIVEQGTERYVFPNDPLVDWEMSYNDNETPVNGALVNGSIVGGTPVIETSGQNPIAIKMSGFLWDYTSHYPEQQLKEFLTMFKKGNVVQIVSSRLFNLLGIKAMRIVRAEFTATRGFEDTQYFDIQAFSYTPVELEILAN